MISIVTAYYNRKALFINTLNSIKKQKFTGELELIAVDDGSDDSERLEDLTNDFPFLKIIRLERKDKWYKNSCIPFNIGFKEAKGDKIIIQNPECFHLDDILRYTQENLIDDRYYSFAAFSLDKPATNNITEILSERRFIDEIISKNNVNFKMDGNLGWYNHSEHRPSFYHFCCAITKKDLYELGGFDERYALGIGGDDIEFVYRIKQKGMVLKIVDDVIALHQNHYGPFGTPEEVYEQKKKDYKRNNEMFEYVTKSTHKWQVNYLGALIPNNKEMQVKIDYQLLLESKILPVIHHKFARKITGILLNFMGKIKF